MVGVGEPISLTGGKNDRGYSRSLEEEHEENSDHLLSRTGDVDRPGRVR